MILYWQIENVGDIIVLKIIKHLSITWGIVQSNRKVIYPLCILLNDIKWKLDLIQWLTGFVRNGEPFLFYPLNVLIYTMNWNLDLPCIALLWLWMWNYPIDDPENGIQSVFILSPFSIRQNIGLNRGTVQMGTVCTSEIIP